MKLFNFSTAKIARSLVFALAATSSLALATSASADALKMDLQANKVVKNSEGKTTYEPVSTANPGTVIQYKATYSNVSDKQISDVLVTLPIPANMTFTGSAYPASAQATIDNKNYADIPLMRQVDGKLVKIPYSEYKSLRWNIKMLPAHKSAAVSLDATVN